MTDDAPAGKPIPRLGVRRVTHHYPGVTALRNVDFELTGGQVHGLVGENGSGKSTLTKVLTGALEPTRGALYMNGRDVSFSSPAEAKEAGIGVAHQDYNLFPDLNVAANVYGISRALPRRRWLPMVDKAELEDRVHSLLASLGIDLAPDLMVRDLGPAERKFVEIARSMLLEPSFLILDEPTASLEPAASRGVLGLLDRLRDRGVGLCFISHRLDEVLGIADVITVLRDGESVATLENQNLTEEQLAEHIIGAKKRTAGPNGATEPSDVPAVRVRGLRVAPELPEIDFDVRRGEIFGLAGLLGSGAAEIVQMLGGARPLDGSLEVGDRRVAVRSPRDASRAGVGFIPEDRKAIGLVADRSVAVNISLASLPRVAGFVGWLKRRKMIQRALEYRQSLDIRTPSVETPVRTLSGGNMQKVMLAKWLASGAKVLAIEEPTHGIDIGAKAQVHRLLRDFASDNGAIVVASTDVHEVLALCHRIGVMRHGSLVEILSTEALTSRDLAVMGSRDPDQFLESLIETGVEGESGAQDEGADQ